MFEDNREWSDLPKKNYNYWMANIISKNLLAFVKKLKIY